MFEWPESGSKGVVHLIKPVGYQIIVKLRLCQELLPRNQKIYSKYNGFIMEKP